MQLHDCACPASDDPYTYVYRYIVHIRKSMCMIMSRKDCKSQIAEDETDAFCEILPILVESLSSVPTGELVKNCCCVLCHQKVSSVAVVSK